MSFLLDALGKADDDRRRAVVPELRTPGHRRNAPTRRVLTLVMLLCLVLFSFAAGYFSRPYIEPGFSLSIVRDDLPRSDQAEITVKEVAVKPVIAAVVPAPEPEAAPVIELSVISYSSVPAERFVMLNGVVVYEGDILATGEIVLEIQPDGVILDMQGQRYTLGLAIGSRN